MEEENGQTKKELGLRERKYGRRPEEEKELGRRRKGRKKSLRTLGEENGPMKMEIERREKKSKGCVEGEGKKIKKKRKHKLD